MSRYYASVRGGKGEATRQGHERSGIESHTRGWTVGVRVVGRPLAGEPGVCDRFDIYATGGSNGSDPDTLIGTVYRCAPFGGNPSDPAPIMFERSDDCANIERAVRFVL